MSKKKRKKSSLKRKKLKRLSKKETPVLVAKKKEAEKVADKKVEDIVKIEEAKKPEPVKNTIKRGKKKQPLFHFETQRGAVLVFLTTLFLFFFIQYVLDVKLSPQAAIAQNGRISSSALEAQLISSDFDVVEVDQHSQGYYLAPGDTQSDAFTFGVRSADQTVILKEVKLTKIGDIDDSALIRATLYEGEDAITSAKLHNGIFYFQRFSSILQPGTYKEYKVKLDLSDKSKSGVRFRFSILRPQDLLLTVNDKPVSALDTYPIDGGYVTVVGWRM